MRGALSLFALWLTVVHSGLSFIAIGDWGAVDLDDSYSYNQVVVAQQMGITGAQLDIDFVINVGDNFYWIGVANLSDPQWFDDYENVYTNPSLMCRWYNVLGNHDYGTNPGCQTQYVSPNNNRWYMPDRNYTSRMYLGNNTYASWVFIDTSPCISQYRSNNSAGWDPPPDEAPEFHDNIIAQNCTAQYEWFGNVLKSVPATDWLFIVGHHPAYEIDVEDFGSLMEAANMSMYFNGHTHALEVYTMDGLSIPYVLSGGGACVNVPNATKDVSDIAEFEKAHHGVDKPTPSYLHYYTTQYYNKIAGFTTHTFSDDYSSLTTKVTDYQGNVIYSFDTYKRG